MTILCKIQDLGHKKREWAQGGKKPNRTRISRLRGLRRAGADQADLEQRQ